ncbi:UPF0301 protein [Planctomycetales bacterium]|nr:UPF0301 protein [Planctomycetales bacterium]
MNYSGKLLIATPALLDPNFRETVILLVQGSDEDGVLGLILNRISDKPIRELWETVFHQNCAVEGKLHLGGPVFGPVFAVHSNSSLYDAEIIPGVYFAASKETMDELVNDMENQFRLFVGNAGWGEGQLAREILEGSWYLAEATQQIIFADETSIWQELIEQVGHSIISEVLHNKNLPDDPLLN